MIKYKVGFHISVSGGLFKSFERASRLGCTTFQIFTTNPRSWAQRDLTFKYIQLFKNAQRSHSDITPVISHISYLPNFASKDERLYDLSIKALISELNRCSLLDIPYLVVHPGKAKDLSEDLAIERIAKALDIAFSVSENNLTVVLLETMAGQGTEIGYRMEQLARIIELSSFKMRIGVCLDTAHLFQAGYPIHEKTGLDEFVAKVDELIGWEKVKVLHLNDSKTEFGSMVDRHWHIGFGKIGINGFKVILSHPSIRKLPIIMETPWGENWDIKNMKTVIKLLNQLS